MNRKEVAKFLSGVAANQVIVHWSFGLAKVLPLDFGIWTLTSSLNVLAMVFWPIATAFLAFYGWKKK